MTDLANIVWIEQPPDDESTQDNPKTKTNTNILIEVSSPNEDTFERKSETILPINGFNGSVTQTEDNEEEISVDVFPLDPTKSTSEKFVEKPQISNKSTNLVSDQLHTNQNKKESNDIEPTLEEYELKLRKNINEALELVNELCTKNTVARDDREEKMQKRQEFEEGALLDADSYRLNPDMMKEPNCAILLPNNQIFIGDAQIGLLIFNLQTKELRKVENNTKWKNPKSAVYIPSTQHILIMMEYATEDNDTYEYFICRFTIQLEYVNRIEAPKFIKEKKIAHFKMCYANQTSTLYLAANTTNNAFLYELTSTGKWTEVYNSWNRNFLDVEVFAVIDPVVELLILESTAYVRLLSIYGSDTVDKKTVAISESPGAMCLDESGNLFVFDRASCKIAQHSRIDFLKINDIAVFGRHHCQINAYCGLLSVLNCQFRDLRLYKYYS